LEIQLNPLKLTDEWVVHWNHFYEINTSTYTDGSFPYQIELQEDIFYFENQSRRRYLDLGWYPEGEAHGQYRLILIEMDDDQDKEIENWNNPLVSFSSRDNKEIKNKVNELLQQVSEGLI
jgi:hypothetical protein